MLWLQLQLRLSSGRWQLTVHINGQRSTEKSSWIKKTAATNELSKWLRNSWLVTDSRLLCSSLLCGSVVIFSQHHKAASRQLVSCCFCQSTEYSALIDTHSHSLTEVHWSLKLYKNTATPDSGLQITIHNPSIASTWLSQAINQRAEYRLSSGSWPWSWPSPQVS